MPCYSMEQKQRVSSLHKLSVKLQSDVNFQLGRCLCFSFIGWQMTLGLSGSTAFLVPNMVSCVHVGFTECQVLGKTVAL